MDMLDRSDQNLKELERLQGILDDRVITIVNQDPKSPRLIQAGRNLREHAKSTVGILKGKADHNYDQMVRSNSDVQIRTAEAVIPQQQDAFLSSLKPDQREYLKQGAEAPSEGGINGRAYRNIHQIISTAGIVIMNDAVDPVSKAKLMNSVVNLQRFYYDNMIREEDRYAFRDQQKATDLISQTGEAFTGVETYIALSGNKEIGKLMHGFMEDMLQDVKDTVNTLRYNTWADWKDMTDRAQKETDVFAQLGKRELMKQHGLITDEQFYFQVVLESNPDYKKSIINDGMMELMGIEENKLPEGLRQQAHEMKSMAYDCAMSTMAYYVPDKDGKPRYMNRGELRELKDKYNALDDEIRSFSDAMKNAGISIPQSQSFEQIQDRLLDLSTDMDKAERYIKENANRSDVDTSFFDVRDAGTDQSGSGRWAATYGTGNECRNGRCDHSYR